MTYKYCVVFLLLGGVCIPFSSCSRDHHDYQEYIHKYHKVSSTTESLLTSVSSTTEALLTSEGSSEEELESSSKETHRNKVKFNETVVQNSGVNMMNENKIVFMARIGIIVGSIIGGICILGCIICCCPSCCRGKRPGFIIASTRDEQAAHLQPPQPIATEYPQQPVIYQQFLPNYPQEQPPPQFPPQYTQEPVQPYPPQYRQEPAQQYPPQYMQQPVHAQQPQYSPNRPQNQYSPDRPQNQYSPTGPEYYNPPEAPPPYDTPSAPKF